MKIVIIGAGPAGYTCAIRMAQKGCEVVVIESKNIGGVCLNEGCIPTKSLLHKSKRKDEWIDSQNSKNEVVNKLTSGIESLLSMNHVKIIKGIAHFESATKIVVDNSEIEFDKAIIATGSVPVKPSFAQEVRSCMDSTMALSLDKLPRKLCIIGGGVVGCEMATIFNENGVSVTIIEAAKDILLGFEEKHVSLLKRKMRAAGIEIHTDAKVESIRETGFSTSVIYKEGEERKSFACDKVLVSVGRKANIDDLVLENAGVEVDKGLIQTDENCKTNVNNIYAIGDCSSNLKLAYWASTQAKRLAESIVNDVNVSMPSVMPYCVFTHPEIARIGAIESSLKDRNIKTAEFPFAASGKALCIEEAEGYLKIIVDSNNSEILGAHMIGPMATELIGIFVPLVMNHCSVKMLENSVFPHPTLSEAISEVVDILNGESVNYKA